MSDADPARLMAAAIALGDRHVGLTGTNPSVGALVVKDGVVVGAGATQPGGAVHAEAVALAQAGDAARGATLYVTLEPCAYRSAAGTPCADLVLASGVSHVVIACRDPNPRIDGRSLERLRDAGIAIETGLSAERAALSFAGHLTFIARNRPYITVKQALSEDGMIAAPGHRPVAITGPAANAQVHLMRARADAVLVAAGTVRADDPSLTCRLPGLTVRSPIRVVLDRALTLSPHSRLLRTARETPVWIVAARDAPVERRDALLALGAEIVEADDLRETVRKLGACGIRSVLVEAGARLARALDDADLIDRYETFHAPGAIGPDGIAAMHGVALASVLESDRYALHDTRRHGADLRRTYLRRRPLHPES